MLLKLKLRVPESISLSHPKPKPIIISADYMKAYSECKQLLEQAELLASDDGDGNVVDNDLSVDDRGFDDKDCFIVLYNAQQFQGARKILDQTTTIQRPSEKILKTVGPCAWRIIR